MLPLDKYYRLQVVKEVSVTDSFLTLPVKTKKCQKENTFDECTTQRYIENLKIKCDCFPLQLGLHQKESLKDSL